MKTTRMTLIVMLLIPFSFFIVSHSIPLLYGIYLSFMDRNGNFIGLENYAHIIDDYRFWGSMKFTFSYAIASTLLNLVFGLFIGVFISSLKKGQNLFKAVFLIPWLIPLTIWGLENRIIFSRDFGIINYVLSSLGLIKGMIPWLGEPILAQLSVVITDVYKNVWYAALLFLVACQNIPRDLYEVAQLDGATRLQMFRYVTLPLLRRNILFIGLMLFIFALQGFDLIYSLTYGGPAFSTHTVALYIFRRSLHYGDYEYGTAISTIWVFILFGIVGTTFALLSRKLMR